MGLGMYISDYWKAVTYFMGVEVYGLNNDSLLNERIQCVEGLIMYSLEMNDMLSQLSKDQLRRDILLK